MVETHEHAAISKSAKRRRYASSNASFGAWGQTNFCKAKVNGRRASVIPWLQCQDSDGSARETNRTSDAWQIVGAMRHLRERFGTHLAIERERPRGKNRPSCEKIWISSEVLHPGNVRHLRQMAATKLQMNPVPWARRTSTRRFHRVVNRLAILQRFKGHSPYGARNRLQDAA